MNKQNGLRQLGVFFVGVMLLMALAGPALAPYDPDAWVSEPFQSPSSARHWLGTDDMGQDLLSGLLHGARHSVLIALLSGIGGTALGTLVGTGAGYLGGYWDLIAMRLVDLQLALPTLPLILVVAFYAGPSLPMLVIVLILTLWAQCAREIRPQAAALRDADFIVAERAMGAAEGDILFRFIVPALEPLIWAQFARLVHRAVFLETAFAFLGLGGLDRPSFGRTLYYANARAAFLGDAWLWWVLPPGLAIAFLVLGFALLGVGRSRGVALGAVMIPPIPAPTGSSSTSFLLDVKDLHVGYSDGDTSRDVLQGLDLQVVSGEVLGLAGVSGSGKSTLVQTLLGILPMETLIRKGGVWLAGEELLRMPENRRRRRRGDAVALVPQAAMQSLNPVRTVGSQLMEVVCLAGHRGGGRHQVAHNVLEQVDLCADLMDAYPHELSGGMRQRVVIAMALIRRPRILLADEPTTGLDPVREEEILSLLVRLCRERRMACILISHDSRILARYCDRRVLLEGGRIVEEPVGRVKRSIQKESALHIGYPITTFLEPSNSAAGRKQKQASPVLLFYDVSFRYPGGARLSGLSLTVRPGECVGLVGPSGVGKSTVARLAMGLLQPAGGEIRLFGTPLSKLHGPTLRRLRRRAHLIFQDPYAALPSGKRISYIAAEPLRLSGIEMGSRLEIVRAALAEAGLTPPETYAGRVVDELSGGERQRVALARALIHRPGFIIADEPTSMLDGPAKYAWLERLDALRQEQGIAVLLISHDLEQVRAFCHRIVCLENGRLKGVYSPENLPAQGEAIHQSLTERTY